MNTLPTHKKVLILKCLVEGMSLRSVARITNVSRNTVTRLLINAGKVCAKYQDETLRNSQCRRIRVSADDVLLLAFGACGVRPEGGKDGY